MMELVAAQGATLILDLQIRVGNALGE